MGQAYEEWNRAKVVICQKLVGTKSLLLIFSMYVSSRPREIKYVGLKDLPNRKRSEALRNDTY